MSILEQTDEKCRCGAKLDPTGCFGYGVPTCSMCHLEPKDCECRGSCF